MRREEEGGPVTLRRPLVLEQEHHYWRRRANRRVRKQRLARGLLRWTLIVTVNLLIGGVLVHAILRGVRSVTASPEFSLERIELVGVERASGERIRQALRPYLERNLFEVRLLEVGAVARRDPWVLATSVKRVLPDTLRVTLRERTPTAVAVIGGVAHLVDATGYVIGPSGPGRDDDLPVLTGLERYRGQELADALRRGVALIERLNRAAGAFADEISELDLSRDDRVLLRTVSRGPSLLLDPERVERNVNPYLRLRREIERQAGPLDYVDLRWADRISVKPVFDPRRGG
jgi:cell division protein FtsQ